MMFNGCLSWQPAVFGGGCFQRAVNMSLARVCEEEAVKNCVLVGDATNPSFLTTKGGASAKNIAAMQAVAYGVGFLAVAFLLYVVMFGASSSGFIGTLHDQLTGCYCLRPIFRLCCGKRCAKFAHKMEDVCCWRPVQRRPHRAAPLARPTTGGTVRMHGSVQ